MRILAVLVAVSVFGCARGVPEGGDEVRVPITGLWTNVSDFDDPPGATDVLDNMTFDKPGVAEVFRGYRPLEATASITGPIHAGFSFRGTQIVHHNTNQISRWTGSAWVTFSGTFEVPAHSASGRVRFEEMAGSLFVTTAAGVYELDTPTGSWRLTGLPQALDIAATLRRTVNETGFAGADGQWAYRVEWGFRNANDRLQIGAPSGRALVVNPAAVEATAANISKTAGSSVVTVINTTHGLVTGEYVDVTLGGAEANFVAGTFQVTVLSATSFTYDDGGSAVFTGNPGNNITYGFTAGRNVSLSIPIPDGITTEDFVLVYRSPKSAGATSTPSDKLAQVYERSPTNLEIAAGSMTVVDIVFDDFRGGLMDISAETALAAKHRPLACADIAQFHGAMFCVNTSGAQVAEFQFVAVGGTYGIQAGDLLRFTDSPQDVESSTWEIDFLAKASGVTPANGEFLVYTTGSAAQNIANTVKSLVDAINAYTSNTRLYATYASGPDDAPGRFLVYGRTPTVEQFTLLALPQTILFGSTIIPTVPSGIPISTIERISPTTVEVNTPIDHGLAVGQTVVLYHSSDTANFPNGTKTVTQVIGTNLFRYTDPGALAGPAANTGLFLNAPTEPCASSAIQRADRLSFSLPDQPWAVPLVNELFIEGRPTSAEAVYPEIRSIRATRDRLYVTSNAGLFQVTGFFPDFAITTLQSPLTDLAPEATVSTGTPGRVYALTEQGYSEVLTSAVTVSTPIQNKFQENRLAVTDATLQARAFALAYPSDFKVFVFLPESSADTKATQAYVWHLRDQTWSRRDIDATCAWMDPVTDKMYLGQSNGEVWVERKAGTANDHRDPTSTTLSYSAAAGGVITMASTSGLQMGDEVMDASTDTATDILNVDSATQITVSSTTGFAGGGGNLRRTGAPITSTIRWSREFTKEGPATDKVFDSGMVLIHPPASALEFSSMAVDFANDYSPAFGASAYTLTANSVMTSQVPFQVPPDKQRGGWLQVQLTHSGRAEKWRILGYTLNYRKAEVKGDY